MKPGTTYITTSSGIRPLLVANELIFAPAQTHLVPYRRGRLLRTHNGIDYSFNIASTFVGEILIDD